MGCEENFITIKLIWHSYLVSSLDNCAHKTPTETGLMNMTDETTKPKFLTGSHVSLRKCSCVGVRV